MQHDQHRTGVIGRQTADQGTQCLDATRRSADRDNVQMLDHIYLPTRTPQSIPLFHHHEYRAGAERERTSGRLRPTGDQRPGAGETPSRRPGSHLAYPSAGFLPA
jgi:hypothetical protein